MLSLISGSFHDKEYDFEWDEKKSRANRKKQGISFDQATILWDDPFLLEFHLLCRGEERWGVVGRVGAGDYLTAIITYRGEVVRIISVRKSTPREIEEYERH